MKTAIDFYERGKQKEANANEYNRNFNYAYGRFICPECGEAVHLTGNKDSNHFSHYKKTDLSVECDRRVDGELIDSIYERIGLPIYLRKSVDSTFSLYMGFRSIPQRLIDLAMQNGALLKIDMRKVYIINNERFSTDNTTLIPLEHVPYGRKYRISYEPEEIACLFSQYWSDYADGFSFDGAIFTVTEKGGKKVRYGDSISTDQEYYWLRHQPQLPEYIPGIDMEKVGQLVLANRKFYVYAGHFESNLSDQEFFVLTRFLRENLQVHLLEKKPKFIPVWPPVMKSEDGYLIENNDKFIFGHIVTGNDIPKVYFYQGTNAKPVEAEAGNFISKIPIDDDNIFVSIDRKYVSGGTLLNRSNRNYSGYEKGVYILNDDGIEVSVDDISDIQSRNIKIVCKQKTSFILAKVSGIIEKFEGIGNYSFEEISSGDRIFIFQNHSLINAWVVKIVNSVKQDKHELNEEKIRECIKRYSNVSKVIMPLRLKIRLQKVGIKNTDTKREIEKLMRENMISLPLIETIGEILDGR